ncbi:MAG: hypothetical protein B5M56_06410 [Desulfococcus sp. 4484_241]|nr:MAG: hypothetical protein B5M56_06410 [Desulfococcus sp. 4484_241]
MAKVSPLKGILYNPSVVENFGDVVSPPYDVISPEYQKTLCERHPNNVVRLILGEPGENSPDHSVFYRAAAKRYRSWLSEKILMQDKEPAFYLSSVTFTVENQSYTRYGIIADVGLEPFEKKIILPHERTSSKVKSDRLMLTKATRANFSPIFSLFSDKGSILSLLEESVSLNNPDISFVDDRGEIQSVWRITDRSIQKQISEIMEDKQLFIADGHHRYETALAYRQWLSENNPAFSENHPANYVLMYLTSIEDPGLVILPAHRLLKGVGKERSDRFLEDAADFFHIHQISFKPSGESAAQAELMGMLKSDTTKNRIGMAIYGHKAVYLLTPKKEALEEGLKDVPHVLKELDVTVLTKIVLMRLLGYEIAELDDEQILSYTSVADDAFHAAFSGKCDMAFLLNATGNDQVRAVAQAGEIMPRKSTFYYPKVFAGLVISSKEETLP